ncbi:MAG: PQQ-like beta-propeller repeat protein [Thermoplasmatales archaeon]|nr:MAG: PQQ-like beta-propeller repeat protein [Thermoplasmatales archaeon]
MNKCIIPILVILLFLSSGFVGISNSAKELKNEVKEIKQELKDEFYSFDCYNEYDFPEKYSSVGQDYLWTKTHEVKIANEKLNTSEILEKTISIPSGGFIDHAWPMQGYNRKHIGRSPYSTASNPGIEKWRFGAGDWCDSSPVIDKDGTIYFGATSQDPHLYAINPDGTLKWKFKAKKGLGDIGSSPAITDDDTIYIATKFGSYIQAINPNGTEKWNKSTPDIDTSITIGHDGVIYYGHVKGVDARYPNGTLKWRFSTGSYVESTPMIDDNGIIYFGSHDTYIYAVYPNGILKWKFKTDGWVHGSPTIGEDGTVYVGSDDTYLYSLYPNNGTTKWKCNVGSMRCSPSIDKNGIIYFGVWEERFYSVFPNGTIKWSFDLGKYNGVWGSTAAISDDGTIYIGVCIDIGMCGGGEIIAFTPSGSVKWRKLLSDSLVDTSPVIGEDGSVYICSSWSGGDGIWGYLHAFGDVNSNEPPEKPNIVGSTEGEILKFYKYRVKANDPDFNPVSYYIDWGDGSYTGWTIDYGSNKSISRYHQWKIPGNYTIKCKAKDTFGEESNWSDPIVINVSGPRIMINDIENGFGIKLIVENIENHTIYNVKYSINIKVKGFVLYPFSDYINRTIISIKEEQTKTLRHFIFGLGSIDIWVNIDGFEFYFYCFLFGPFVYKIPY